MKNKLLTACLALAICNNAGASLDAARGQEKTAAKPDACCAVKAEGKPDACCAAKPAVAAKDACCADAAKIENRESKIENFTKESLYQVEAGFTDDAGRAFKLGELRGRPVVLTMFFASCGFACPLLVTDMQAIREKLPAAVRARAQFVLVSFDTARDTPAALAAYRAKRDLDAGWTLLHGDDDAVRELAALLGVKYQQDASGMFSHSNLVTVLNPEGEVVHQRVGLKGGQDEAAAAVTASAR